MAGEKAWGHFTLTFHYFAQQDDIFTSSLLLLCGECNQKWEQGEQLGSGGCGPAES